MIDELKRKKTETFGIFVGILICFFGLNSKTFAWVPDDLLFRPGRVGFGSISQDLQLLRFALVEGYIGFRVLPHGVKMSALEQLNLIEKRAAQLSKGEFCDQLGNLLGKIPDRHLMASLGKKKCPANESSQRKGSVGVNFASHIQHKIQETWAISSVEVGRERIPILSLFRFPDPKHPDWLGFDEKFKEALKSRALVIDLRGNRGGDDTQAFAIARQLIGDKFITPQESKKTLITPVARALYLNRMIVEKERIQNMKLEVPRSVLEEEILRRKSYEAGKNNQLVPPIEEYTFFVSNEKLPEAKSFFNRPVYLLMDAECGSTGELLALALKNSDLVTTVGENTAGFLEFGNAGILILPYSRIEIDIPVTFKKFREIQGLEKIGITPDVLTPHGEDALDWVKKALLRVL